MNNLPSMARIAALQRMIADFSHITRVPAMPGAGRLENDVDHSYGLAMTCWYLHEKIAPELDLLKIFKYSLAHDIVELHAGDTYIFDEARSATKDAREREALSKIKSDWPDFSDMSAHAEGYMDKTDAEAKFVKAVDKLLPVIMIELDDNPKAVWDKLDISLAMERENKVTILISREVSPYYELLLEWLDDRGNIKKS